VRRPQHFNGDVDYDRIADGLRFEFNGEFVVRVEAVLVNLTKLLAVDIRLESVIDASTADLGNTDLCLAMPELFALLVASDHQEVWVPRLGRKHLPASKKNQ
jgi:hypothetical protein